MYYVAIITEKLDGIDTAMSTGPGLRWSLAGPYMTSVLGGGGDFRHFINHIGRASTAWLEDMDKHRFEYTTENIDRLSDNVEDWTKTVDLESVERERDEFLADLVKSKAGSRHLK